MAINKQTLKWVILGGLFLIPFIPFLVSSSFFFPFITSKAFAFRIMVEIVFFTWVILALLDEAYRPRATYVLYAVAAFLVTIGLADLLGMNPVKSFWSNFERMEGYVTLLHLGAFFLVSGSVLSENMWKRWWNTSLAASGLVVVYSLFQLLGVITINQGGVRVDATFGNASYLAVYLLFHFFLAMLFFWRERRRTAMRWVYGLLAFSNLFILYHTATRGAILGVLGGVVVFALLSLRSEDKRLRKTSMGVLAVLVLLVGGFWLARNTALVQGSPTLARFADISTTELRGGGRSFVWPMALEGVKERPLLGWGQENFNYVFQEHYSPDMYHLEPWFDRAHNIFLDWAVAGGILGLLAYLSLYGTLLYMVWKLASFTYTEKSLITALVAAYFFHNLFVFDHLVSYILFFSLLAYVHSRGEGKVLSTRTVPERRVLTTALPVVAVTLLLVLYFINIRPMSANATLIEALKAMQTGERAQAVQHFESAYERSRLGRPEVVEQIASNSISILQSSMPIEERNEFFAFVREAVADVAEDLESDARYQMMAGALLYKTGQFEEADVYLSRAQELMPNKQAIYFERAAFYINQDKYDNALVVLAQAYQLAPEYTEAKLIFLVGAIYADARTTEERMISELNEEAVVFDDRVLSAYYDSGRRAEAVRILEKRIELDAANEERYREMIRQVRG